MKRLLCVGVGLAAATLLPRVAAAESLHVAVGETVVLTGDHLYDDVVVNGELLVAPYDGSMGGGLKLRAINVVIGPDGVIDASGAGYRGGEGTDGGGEGHDDGIGAGQTLPSQGPATPLPGGGGSHLGIGGAGFNIGCTTLLAAAGGSYDELAAPLGLLGFGSAGGSSQAGTPNDGAVGRGGHGGGAILISAATLSLEGKLLANGLAAPLPFGAAAGGGAGGSVWLHIGQLTLGANASIQARGGDGSGPSAPRNNVKSRGGGGGGGLLVVTSQLDAAALSAVVDVAGGSSSGGEPACSGADASAGQTRLDTLVGCLDLDDDDVTGFCVDGSDPLDCDDANPLVNPDATEVCNGRDDNCDGESDEETAPLLCSAGTSEKCVEGTCTPATPVDAGSAPPAAPKVKLHGGLCALKPARSHDQKALWLLLVALVALGNRRSGRTCTRPRVA